MLPSCYFFVRVRATQWVPRLGTCSMNTLQFVLSADMWAQAGCLLVTHMHSKVGIVYDVLPLTHLPIHSQTASGNVPGVYALVQFARTPLQSTRVSVYLAMFDAFFI